MCNRCCSLGAATSCVTVAVPLLQTTAWLGVAALAILSVVYFVMMVAFCIRMFKKDSVADEAASAQEREPLFE